MTLQYFDSDSNGIRTDSHLVQKRTKPFSQFG